MAGPRVTLYVRGPESNPAGDGMQPDNVFVYYAETDLENDNLASEGNEYELWPVGSNVSKERMQEAMEEMASMRKFLADDSAAIERAAVAFGDAMYTMHGKMSSCDHKIEAERVLRAAEGDPE